MAITVATDRISRKPSEFRSISVRSPVVMKKNGIRIAITTDCRRSRPTWPRSAIADSGEAEADIGEPMTEQVRLRQNGTEHRERRDTNRNTGCGGEADSTDIGADYGRVQRAKPQAAEKAGNCRHAETAGRD